jgi:hypothetical protein
VAPVPNCPSQESICASLQCRCRSQSLEQSLRVSDAGGSRRSYRNGRVLLCLGKEHPPPQGLGREHPSKSSVGGTPGWSSASARWYGQPSPGVCVNLSVRRNFRPGRSPASRGSGVAKSMAKPSSRSARGHRHACVACRSQFDLVLTRRWKTRSQGGGPQVLSEGRVRACLSLRACFSTSKHSGLVSVIVVGRAPCASALPSPTLADWAFCSAW